MKKLRILIADDHSMIRQGIRSVLQGHAEWELCGECDNGRAAVELARSLAPDVAIMDVTMPELNGVDAIRHLKLESPGTKSLILTMHDSDTLASQVLDAGGRGYLLKSDAAELLPMAIEAVASGRLYLTKRLSRVDGGGSVTPKHHPAQGPTVCSRLTPREREVLQGIAEGKSNKEVAGALQISTGTVETHRKNILCKLNARSTADLVRYAIRNQLIQA